MLTSVHVERLLASVRSIQLCRIVEPNRTAIADCLRCQLSLPVHVSLRAVLKVVKAINDEGNRKPFRQVRKWM